MLLLTERDEQTLLRLAREALEAALFSWSEPPLTALSTAIAQQAGAFVTLRKSGQLRGCVGRIRAFTALHRTVRECAIAAALCDPRFPPVRGTDLPGLRLEISVLSQPVEASPDEIEVGRHGLLISQGSRQGILLPQVANEWNWDRIRFLEETCIKAGLGPAAWREGAHIEIFTAQVFGECGTDESAFVCRQFKKPA